MTIAYYFYFGTDIAQIYSQTKVKQASEKKPKTKWKNEVECANENRDSFVPIMLLSEAKDGAVNVCEN